MVVFASRRPRRRWYKKTKLQDPPYVLRLSTSDCGLLTCDYSIVPSSTRGHNYRHSPSDSARLSSRKMAVSVSRTSELGGTT